LLLVVATQKSARNWAPQTNDAAEVRMSIKSSLRTDTWLRRAIQRRAIE
jgi:hypothetical protein